MRPCTISVLIVSYNVGALLRQCLTALQGEPHADVIVIDNASCDDSAAIVATSFPWVRLVRMADNAGFAAAINTGAKLAVGNALLLLNPDTQLPPGALGSMAQALGCDAKAGAIGFRQVDADGTFQLACGPEPTFAGELARCFVQRRLDAGNRFVAQLTDRVLARRRPVAWVAGSSLLVWRQAFEQVGGFDSRYFLFFEDIDFCLRLRAQGYQIYYDPCVTLLHHRGASAKIAPKNAQRAYRRSQMRFWRTHRRGLWAPLIAMYAARRAPQ